MPNLTGYATPYPDNVTRADAFVRFIAQQKVGRKITVTAESNDFHTVEKAIYHAGLGDR